MPIVSGLGGFQSVPQGAIQGKGAPAASFQGQLGQNYFDTTQSPPREYVYNGQSWVSGGASLATYFVPGSVYLGTYAELSVGTAPNLDYVPSTNDVYTFVNTYASSGGVPSTTTTEGITYLASNAQAAAGVLTTNYAINPGLRIGYAYDHIISDLKVTTPASHEIMILFDLNFPKKVSQSPRYF